MIEKPQLATGQPCRRKPTWTRRRCRMGWAALIVKLRRGRDGRPRESRILRTTTGSLCARKRPCTPKDTILTPGFGYSITPVPKFPDRPGRENRVHFSYASDVRLFPNRPAIVPPSSREAPKCLATLWNPNRPEGLWD